MLCAGVLPTRSAWAGFVNRSERPVRINGSLSGELDAPARCSALIGDRQVLSLGSDLPGGCVSYLATGYMGLMESIVLNNGVRMPRLGLGTWRLAGERCVEVVRTALNVGYRHIDTAQMYQNEAEVGTALRGSGLARGEVFVTTKIWPDRHEPKEFARAVDESLAALRLDHVDLLLLHWPSQEVPLGDTLGALNAALKTGKTRAIGVSNFTVSLMQRAAALSDQPLAVNQIEYHVLLRQKKVPACARRLGIALTAYRPLAKARSTSTPCWPRSARNTARRRRRSRCAGSCSSRTSARSPRSAANPTCART
jgi:diketogulonate reductase-like aldo/keto reductase